jgi:Ni/Co efflux regulator RcnB
MRKFLLTLLLASAAATPALARPNDDNSDRQAAREERQAQRAERQAERQAQQTPAQRPHFDAQRQFNGGGNGQQAVVQQQRVQMDDAQREAFRAERQRTRSGDGAQVNGGNWQQRRQQVLQNQNQPEGLRQNDRPLPNVLRTRARTGMNGIPPQGTQPPMRVDNHRRDRVRWDTNWRHNDRYDWRRWRDRHRSSFHLGIYYDPFGWNYQPFSIGYRLWPNYYSSNYWINDPWQYRLPYAPPGTQWIRYYDDALLVDMYSGQVVDVIRNFFW